MSEEELIYKPYCPDVKPCPKVVKIGDEMTITWIKPYVELKIKGIKG